MDYKEKVIALLNSQELSKEQKEKLESIFPELSESEDERIRKALVDTFKFYDSPMNSPYLVDISKKDILAWLEKQKIEKQGKQKPAEWSEEDEKIYQSIMDDTVQENQLNSNQTNWLRDIKYRYFPQPKQKWSEEDEKILNYLLWFYDTRFRWNDTCCDDIKFGDIVTFLKSLKDRVQPKQEIE